MIARGIERRTIFCDEKDERMFLEILGHVLSDTATPCYSFCLIPNHFHLLLRRDNHPIASVMSRILTSYALRFNKRHERAGHLFQNRYKSTICQDNHYFLELVRYINLNPVRAELTDLVELENYFACSHAYILGIKNIGWFNSEAVISYFGETSAPARMSYLDFLRAGLSTELSLSGGGLRRSMELSDYPERSRQASDDRILGGPDFVERLIAIEGKHEDLVSHSDPQEVIDDFAKTCSITLSEITSKAKRRPVVRARSTLVHKLAQEAGLTQSEIGRWLDLTESAVSKIMKRASDAPIFGS